MNDHPHEPDPPRTAALYELARRLETEARRLGAPAVTLSDDTPGLHDLLAARRRSRQLARVILLTVGLGATAATYFFHWPSLLQIGGPAMALFALHYLTFGSDGPFWYRRTTDRIGRLVALLSLATWAYFIGLWPVGILFALAALFWLRY